MRSCVVLFSAVALLASGCVFSRQTSGDDPRPRPGCELRSSDSVFMAGRSVYRECAVDVAARNLTRGEGPTTRPSGPRPDGCHFVELAFVVDTTGKPEVRGARILQTSDQDYAYAVRRTLPTWRYEPARLGSVLVRQIVTDREMVSVVVQRVTARSAAPRAMPGC
ncbi:MAG: hypothetical protein M3Z05_02755 [Gemmatimonadota bacterium]|nr:hypothetical protein [Gemmatimonadota bacterium]